MYGCWRIVAVGSVISLLVTACCSEAPPVGGAADSVRSLVETVHQWQQDKDSASQAKRAVPIIEELVASLAEKVYPDGGLSGDVDSRLTHLLPMVSKFKVEQEAFAEWTSSMRNQDWPIRVAAYFLIGLLRAEPKRAEPVLCEALKDTNPDVRLSALRSLKRLESSLEGDEWLDAVGSAALNEEDWALGREFASVLQSTKRKEHDGDGLSIEKLQALMEDENADVDSKVVEVYLLWLSPKKLDNERVVQLVSGWMDRTENLTLKEACAVCLSRLSSTHVEDATLKKMLESDRPLVLAAACDILAEQKKEVGTDLLRLVSKACQHSNSDVRCAAFRTLEHCVRNNQEFYSSILACILKERDTRVMRAGVRALLSCGRMKEDSREFLTQAAKSRDYILRSLAMQTLTCLNARGKE